MTLIRNLSPEDLQPADAVLVDAEANNRITPDGRPTKEWRTELRRIPDARNGVTVLSVWFWTVVICAVAVLTFPNPAVLGLAFLLMGTMHARFAILMHESAHRLLFSNRRVNDFVGKWIIAYPAFVPIDLYRRGHMAHHREEFGPGEPDIPLYRGYPISTVSFRRKLTRDAVGITGLKLHKGLVTALWNKLPGVRRIAWGIAGTQFVLLGIAVLSGNWWVYPLLWFLPHLTVWRVINRLRSIAEHGGMRASRDRRRTTHSVRQSLTARFAIVPYRTGWHLAHHLDAGIPFRRLPEYHRELIRAGYVQPGLEYPNYRALWRALSSG